MLLKELKLQNIRSYLEETIAFPDGSIIISGDIGGGKSSILLAIEFALFGTSRPDLPAEALLRKGASQGEVELTFVLDGKEITIKRGLKKEKRSIKQLSGYVIINGVKKELTPVELKAEMISWLGYPEEFISKNKNYIFRYTIYTPQEEMKFILQENPDTRLDVLRKIFNIDKYKNIRESLQFYLKKMRTRIAVLKTKLEPLEEQKEQLRRLKGEKEEVERELQKLLPLLSLLQKKIVGSKKRLEEWEQKQKQFLELQKAYSTTQALLKEKQEQQERLVKKKEEVLLQISQLSLPEGGNLESVKEEIEKLELQKNEHLSQKSVLQEKVQHLQRSIKETQQELETLGEELATLEQKEKLLQELTAKVSGREEIEGKRKQLEELLEKTSELITKNKTILQQSKEAREKIDSLDTCPTCFQTVSSEHKQEVVGKEEQKMKRAENLLGELNQKKEEIVEQKEVAEQQIKEIILEKNQMIKAKMELKQLREKQAQSEQKQEQLKSWVQENNQVMDQLALLTEGKEMELVEKKLSQQKELLNNFLQQQHWEKNLQELEQQMNSQQEQLHLLQEKFLEIENTLKQTQDFTKEIEEVKQGLANFQEQEKELSVQKAQKQTSLDHLVRQLQERKEVVGQLLQEKEKLIRYRELYRWLEKYFLNLTYTIEKQIMVNIHHVFNQLFQEWFSILLDDEMMSGRIDDSFAPVIEQNGYEMGFTNLSGGERTSAALAYRLALNKVINEVVQTVKTRDLLILDEPTDGFSSEQLDKVRDVLERLNLKQTIIVSHESKIESFVEHVIRIGKEGHVSKAI